MPTAVQGRGAPRVLASNQEELLAAATGGDEHAFAVLVTALTPSLLRFAECILRDSERASAAVQDAWLMGWGALRAFESVSHLTKWMIRVVRHRAISETRKKRRVRSAAWSDEPGEEPGHPSPAAQEPDALPDEVAFEVRGVVEALKGGVAPWVRPWRTIGDLGGLRNAVSGYQYSGITHAVAGQTTAPATSQHMSGQTVDNRRRSGHPTG